MKNSIIKGLSFGLTSGIITTLGLIVGLNSSTQSKAVIVSAILIIAIADAMSDAFGIHISEESESRHTAKELWESTFSTLIAKAVFALTFIIPILLLSLNVAIIVCIIWGLFLMTAFNYYIAKKQNIKPYKIILEHLTIAVVVIILTNFIGNWIKLVVK